MVFWKIKLRTLLLSVFLSTIVASSALIIFFTYANYSKSIHKLSLEMIDRAGYKIYENIRCIVREVETLPALGRLSFTHHPEFDTSNRALIDFFLEILKHDPNLLAYYIGLTDGSYLIAINPSLSTEQSILHSMPQGTSFVVLLSKRPSQDGVQLRAYFDQDFNLISTQTIQSDFDPRIRPWFIGAEQTKALYWTDPYLDFYTEGGRSLSAAEPFYDKSGQLSSIIGADLSFDPLSKFLDGRALSQHGNAFILNTQGKILLPKNNKEPSKQGAASEAFHTFEQTKSNNFSYKYEGEKFLATIHPFPTSYNKHWSIAFIAPLSDFFADLLSAQQNAILLSLCILLVASLLVVILSIHISKPIVQIANEIDRIARLDLESKTKILSHIGEIDLIDTSVSSMRIALRSFARYVPKELAKQLMRKEREISLGGEKKIIAIFFTDIANFTAISEMLPIEKINSLLTEYFEILTEIIVKCGGTVDKYIGDSIMSIWGAPDELPDFAARACTAALLCQKRLDTFHEQCKKEGMPELTTRMGINTGPVIVGNFGTAERMNYSAIGDAVNTAARLQGLNKTYHTQIIVDQETTLAAGSQFLTRPLELVELRGKKKRIKVFELVAQKGGPPEIQPRLEQIELCAQFTEAFHAFERGDPTRSKALFDVIHKQFPEDYPTLHYLQKLTSS